MRGHLNRDRSRVGRKARLASATDRQQAREGRTNDQQVALLDERLGAGQGATRERARLSQTISKQRRKRERKGA